MSYAALLEELDELQKAMPTPDLPDEEEDEDEDDKKQHDEPDADNDGGLIDDDEDNEPMTKSFRFELDSGESIEAIDATELIKSLHADIYRLRSNQAQDESAVEQGIAGLLKVVKSQGQLLKSLQAQVAKLGNSGNGRKSVLFADNEMLKAQAPELTSEQLMLKAQTAYDAGRITGKELSTLDVLMRYGETPDADLVRRILV